ncbi:hypothetical protein H8959_021369 [Pygathrix nigripes]
MSEGSWAQRENPKENSGGQRLVAYFVYTAAFQTALHVCSPGRRGKCLRPTTASRHEGKASPPTGLVKATQRCAPYFSSHFPNVVLWDLPGTGSATKTLENYLMEMQFNQYDFIMVASAQFSMNHVMLAKTIEDMGKFYVVWTKLDMDLSTGALPEV